MSKTAPSIRVVIPLTPRKRNGRLKMPGCLAAMARTRMCCAPLRGPGSGGGSWRRGRLPLCRILRGRKGCLSGLSAG